MKLANKVALITGAGSGMGRAGAPLFALEGAKVAVVDIDQRSAAQTAREIETAGGKAIALGADVSKREDSQTMVAATVEKLGVPDIVYNNAGIEGESAFMAQLSEDAFDRVRLAAHGEEGRRLDNQHRLDRGDGRDPRRDRLLRGKGRRDRSHPRRCARIRPLQYPRQLHLPRHD
jgi:hypothetical protein